MVSKPQEPSVSISPELTLEVCHAQVCLFSLIYIFMWVLGIWGHHFTEQPYFQPQFLSLYCCALACSCNHAAQYAAMNPLLGSSLRSEWVLSTSRQLSCHPLTLHTFVCNKHANLCKRLKNERLVNAAKCILNGDSRLLTTGCPICSNV